MAEAPLKWNATRIFILIMVGVFFLSTVGFTAFVIYEQFFADESNSTTVTDIEDTDTTTTKLQGAQLTGFTPTAAPVTELEIIDTVAGSGAVVSTDSTITAHYTGALVATGVIFQSSLDSGSPFTSPLIGLIEGWQEGIPGMKVGGTRRLLIPAEMAYGSAAQDGIPANSDLVFDIQLISAE